MRIFIAMWIFDRIDFMNHSEAGPSEELQKHCKVTRIPFVIGMTGHRDPDPVCLDQIKSKFIETLEQVKKIAPHTPIVFLSPLAEGCDQLAAEWALDWAEAQDPLDNNEPRLRLGCSMPFARHEYIKDFEKEKVLQKFEELEKRAAFVFHMPKVRDSTTSEIAADNFDWNTTSSAKPIEGNYRAKHYEELGKFTAERSQLVIAFWNRVPVVLQGGTAHVVSLCDPKKYLDWKGSKNTPLKDHPWMHETLSRAHAPFRASGHILGEHLQTPVVVIPTVRLKKEELLAIDSEWKDPFQHKLNKDQIAEGEICLSTYLEDLDRLNKELVPSRSYFKFNWPEDRSPSKLNGETVAMWDRYRTLNAIAIHKKKMFIRNVTGLTGLMAVAVGLFQWFATHDSVHGPAWIYIFLMVLAFGWFCCLRSELFEQSFIRIPGQWWKIRIEWIFVHTRTIAEALRVQFAWALSGVPTIVTDHYMSRHLYQTRFLRTLIKASSVEIFYEVSQGKKNQSSQHDGPDWIKDQIKYMKKKMDPTLHKWHIRFIQNALNWFERILPILILVLSVLLAIYSWREHQHSAPHGDDGNWLPFGAFLVGVLLFSGVALEYHANAVLHEEDLDRYEYLLPVYERAEKLLSDVLTMDAEDSEKNKKICEIVKAMGKEAIDEQTEWFVKHRNSLRVPSVG